MIFQSFNRNKKNKNLKPLLLWQNRRPKPLQGVICPVLKILGVIYPDS
jgi:hypothetical protein